MAKCTGLCELTTIIIFNFKAHNYVVSSLRVRNSFAPIIKVKLFSDVFSTICILIAESKANHFNMNIVHIFSN